MLTIERLSISLPTGVAPARAPGIARAVGDRLAAIGATDSATIERLSLDPIVVPAGASDGEIAGRIAEAIGRAIAAQGGQR